MFGFFAVVLLGGRDQGGLDAFEDDFLVDVLVAVDRVDDPQHFVGVHGNLSPRCIRPPRGKSNCSNCSNCQEQFRHRMRMAVRRPAGVYNPRLALPKQCEPSRRGAKLLVPTPLKDAGEPVRILDGSCDCQAASPTRPDQIRSAAKHFRACFPLPPPNCRSGEEQQNRGTFRRGTKRRVACRLSAPDKHATEFYPDHQPSQKPGHSQGYRCSAAAAHTACQAFSRHATSAANAAIEKPAPAKKVSGGPPNSQRMPASRLANSVAAPPMQ